MMNEVDPELQILRKIVEVQQRSYDRHLKLQEEYPGSVTEADLDHQERALLLDQLELARCLKRLGNLVQ